jgi:hypothetical protein
MYNRSRCRSTWNHLRSMHRHFFVKNWSIVKRASVCVRVCVRAGWSTCVVFDSKSRHFALRSIVLLLYMYLGQATAVWMCHSARNVTVCRAFGRTESGETRMRKASGAFARYWLGKPQYFQQMRWTQQMASVSGYNFRCKQRLRPILRPYRSSNPVWRRVRIPPP